MKFITQLKRSALVQLGAFALIVVGSVSAHAQGAPQNIPAEGIYTGFIQVATGPAVAMSLQLRLSNTDVPGDPGDAIPFKKQFIGTFTIENEAGPYNLAYVDFSVEQSFFDLYYVRSSAGASTGNSGGSSGGSAGGSTGGSSGSAGSGAPSVYSLHFAATFANSTISGTVDSGLRGNLGKFSLKLDPKQTGLVTRSQIAVGNFQGDWVFDGQDKENMKLYLTSNAGVQTNPADLELDNTPARIGSVLFNDLLIIPFSQIFIDYFTHTIRMSYSNSTNGAGVSIAGSYTANSITGSGASAFNGKPGNFTVNRMTPSTGTTQVKP